MYLEMNSAKVDSSGKMLQKTAVLYLRVSSEDQVQNYSLDNQEQACTREAEKRGYKVIKTFREEGKSAKTIKGRPTLLDLLEHCRKNKQDVDAVIVFKIDRMARETSDYLLIRKQLASYGIDIISASEPTGSSPAEKFVETLLAATAEFDNAVRGERTKSGLRSRFLVGLPISRVPLGYFREGKMVHKSPDSFDLVKKAWDLMVTGRYSLKDIAKQMNTWGLREFFHGKTHTLRGQTASRIFKNKFYMGILTSSRYPEEIRGQWEPMITEDQFYKVQAIITGRTTFDTNIARAYDNEDFPLRRIARCSCGAVLTGAWTQGRNQKYAYYFGVTGVKRCGCPSIPAIKIETTLLNLLRKVTPTKEQTESFLLRLHTLYSRKLASVNSIRKQSEEELAKLHQERITIAEKNSKGLYSDEIYKELDAKIELKIITFRVAKNDSLIERYDIEGLTAYIRSLLSDLGKAYLQSTLPLKKFLLGSIFPKGLFWNHKGYFEPSLSPLYKLKELSDPKIAFSSAYGIRTRDYWDENPVS